MMFDTCNILRPLTSTLLLSAYIACVNVVHYQAIPGQILLNVICSHNVLTINSFP